MIRWCCDYDREKYLKIFLASSFENLKTYCYIIKQRTKCQVITELIRPFETFAKKLIVSHATQTSKVSRMHYINLHMYYKIKTSNSLVNL